MNEENLQNITDKILRVGRLLYNPKSELAIMQMIEDARQKGYVVKRRGGLRRILGGGRIDIPPFVNPPEGKKGVAEVSTIYATVHELDPCGGHLAQFEQMGTDVYRNLRDAEIEASLITLRAVLKYGLFTDPFGLLNQLINIIVYGSGLGELLYKIRHRKEYNLLRELEP